MTAMIGLRARSCDNGNGSEGVGSTARSLTHSLDYTEEGLALKATLCEPYEGPAYQEYALRSFLYGNPLDSILPWIWFSTKCGTATCLYYPHLVITAPVRIKYPALLCIYCGLPGGTKDHLLPRCMTGDAQRKFVAVVPACGECNSMVNDFPNFRIGARRERAHDGIRRKYAKHLTPCVDYRKFDGYLRSYVKAADAKKDQLEARLAWPFDPDFDLRAFQKSGIEDPNALGLI